MKMSPADIAAHPKFHQYIKNEMPKMVHVNPIISAIKKFSGATSRFSIKQALTWGTEPSIEIVTSLHCDAVSAYGCYPVWGGNKIQIDRNLVRAFEAGRDKRLTTSGLLVSVAGATLLHELTHWADAKDGFDNPVPGDPLNEEGNAFELEVYGKILDL